MNIIKRLTTSVSATLENAVGELENHDAIVEANIKQTRQAVAKTQARLASLQQQQTSFESQLNIAREQIDLWEGRAKSIAVTDEPKALQCLTRRNQSEAEVRRLTQAIDQQSTLITQVADNLHKLKTKLDEMSQRHNLMRSRQTVAEVNRAACKADHSQQLNDTFERWEASVLDSELSIGTHSSNDPLDVQFAREELGSELQAQLAELKAQSDTPKDK